MDNVLTEELWLASLVACSFTPIALASCFAKRDAQACFVQHAGNNTVSSIAVPYSIVEIIISLTLVSTCLAPGMGSTTRRHKLRLVNILEEQ